jgi:hypothetical protein
VNHTRGKYLEPATSSHPIKAEGHEIRLDFISLVRELNFARYLEENPYKHLQDFEEICATLMISAMNHETLKWKAFLFSLMGWAKQWYKLHVSSCHGSWVVLKDQFCFAFFPLSKIIDLRNEVLSFTQKEGEISEQPGLNTSISPCQVQSSLYQMLCSCSIS